MSRYEGKEIEEKEPMLEYLADFPLFETPKLRKRLTIYNIGLKRAIHVYACQEGGLYRAKVTYRCPQPAIAVALVAD